MKHYPSIHLVPRHGNFVSIDWRCSPIGKQLRKVEQLVVQAGSTFRDKKQKKGGNKKREAVYHTEEPIRHGKKLIKTIIEMKGEHIIDDRESFVTDLYYTLGRCKIK